MRFKLKMRVTQLNYLFMLIIALGFSPSAIAQSRLARDYLPEEYLSLSKDLPIEAALAIINQLSEKYENKLVLDSKEHKNKIGVDVDNMHWKRALEYIMRSNNLKVEEHPRHYEVVDDSKTNELPKEFEKVTHVTREVEIKAIFFEADQQALSETGIDWTTLKDGKVQFRMDSKNAVSVTEDIFSATGRFSVGAWNVSTLIKAFQANNKGQVLATPTIRIMEGEEGKIKVGKNFFLTTRDFAGNTRYSEYESGTILTVLPKVIRKGKLAFIHLEIAAEKSDVVPSTVGVTKKITEGRTQVLLLNGEETAMAGLLSNEVTDVRKGVPFLKNLPWWMFGLRYIFGYSSHQVTKKELVILIEAQIVPSIISRLRAKITKKNYLKTRRKEFNKRLGEFKNR